MGVLNGFAATIFKMFAADIALSLIALAAVALCAAGEQAGLIGRGAVPFALAAGVLGALAVGVARGARR